MIIRELTQGEWGRLEGHLLFEKTGVPNPDFTKIIIAENEVGEIVGMTCMVQVVHVEPWWVHESYRGGTLVGRMWNKTRVLLDQLRTDVVFCFSDRSEISDYLARLNFRELPYRTFLFDPKGKYPEVNT